MVQDTLQPPPSYIIVGAGVFGTSTALHLIRKYPSASVTLIDRDPYDQDFVYHKDPQGDKKPEGARVAASWDWNKVVRADYADRVYCRLALEAQQLWRRDPLWKQWYTESGIYWISRTGIGQQVVDNFTALLGEGGGGGGSGVGQDDVVALPETIPVEQARKLYGGIFDEADYTGIDKVLVNRTSGWADAKGALRAATDEAVRLGVHYVTAEVEELLFSGSTVLKAAREGGVGGGGLVCPGVRTASGKVIEASHVILCTGAYTPRLLEQSAARTGYDALRAGERIIAAGVTTGLVTLDDNEAETFRGMPVCCQENPPERGASNGTLPITKENQIKWWGQRIFKNTLPVPPLPPSSSFSTSKEVKTTMTAALSMPPQQPDYAEWSVPPALQDDVRFANKITFGTKGEKWEVEQFRICWEALTPSHDFIISPHPAAAASSPASATGGLYVATCGSFHGWKFFPVIGAYVVAMLEGTLDAELAQKWAWDREIKRVPGDREWPEVELGDIWKE